MNLKTGAIIKKLRTENNITQEVFANALGVTPQAISRWEAEGCYPDIELLPAIADFFSVSTDELLGYRQSEREKHLGEIKEEMKRLSETENIDEQISFARLALSKYPADPEIKENLAVNLYLLWDDTKDEKLLSEAESLALSVTEACRDEDIRYDAINLLIYIYAKTDRSQNAVEMTKLLAPMKYCREFAKSAGLGDGKTEIYRQDEIDKLADSLGTAIQKLAWDGKLPKDPAAWDKKIRMIDISTELYKLIYGDNLMFYHSRLSLNYWIKSTYQTAQGKVEEALDSLEEMCRHAVAYDASFRNDHGKPYTSILMDKLVYPEPGRDFHELAEHSHCHHMLNRMENMQYDSIRNTKRFLAVIDTLKKYAD